MRFIDSFWHNQCGATCVEYAVLIGMLAIAIMSVMASLGAEMQTRLSMATGDVKAIWE